VPYVPKRLEDRIAQLIFPRIGSNMPGRARVAEDEDRVAAFLEAHPDFKAESASDAAIASGLLTEQGASVLRANSSIHGSVRLTPRRAGTDGFFFAVLRRAGRAN